MYVPAFIDLKLHDICSGPDDPNTESLDMQPARTSSSPAMQVLPPGTRSLAVNENGNTRPEYER